MTHYHPIRHPYLHECEYKKCFDLYKNVYVDQAKVQSKPCRGSPQEHKAFPHCPFIASKKGSRPTLMASKCLQKQRRIVR